MTVTLWIIGLAAALAYLPICADPPSLRRTIIKTLPLCAGAIIALIAGAPWLLVMGLGLSALGDAFLSRDGDAAFMGGLGSFLLAHICYAVLFFSGEVSLSDASPFVLAGVALFAAGFGFALVRRAGPLALPVAVYVGAIAVMGFGAAVVGGLVLLGACLFMASDAILGSEKFLLDEAGRARRFTGPAIWVLYVAGQAFILLGLLPGSGIAA